MINDDLEKQIYQDLIDYDDKLNYYIELSHSKAQVNDIPVLFHTSEIFHNIFNRYQFSKKLSIDNQDDDFFLELISQHGSFIKYKKKMSLDFIKKALLINGGTINHIPKIILNNNKEMLFKLSIDHNSQNILFCKNPTQELIQYAVNADVENLMTHLETHYDRDY